MGLQLSLQLNSRLRAGFSVDVAELSLRTKTCLPTIAARSQAHFLSSVVNGMYVPLVYACLAVLCITIYETEGVLAGSFTAIIMPKRKNLMADIVLLKNKKFVLSKSHISMKNKTGE